MASEKDVAVSGFEPELGQALFGGPWETVEMEDHVRAGIDALSFLIAGDDFARLHITNSGAEEFDNGTFELRSYCWCDGGQHPDGCPPNFKYGDFEARWYKHSGRGSSQNRPVPLVEWREILACCVASLEGDL